MIREYFQSLEHANHGHQIPLNELIDHLPFNEQGLIPVITQDIVSKQVLMLAWMNISALQETISSKQMTYWSRSRNKLWKKGETSSNTQQLVNMSFDCDGDAILCEVHQSGSACHTGRKHCFYFKVNSQFQQVHIQGNHS